MGKEGDEFVPLVRLRFRGVKAIDVIERSRPPRNCVVLEPGDLEVDFVWFCPIFVRSDLFFWWGGNFKSNILCIRLFRPRLVVRQCVNTLVHRYTGALVHRYTDTLVHRYTGTPGYGI